MVRGPPELGCPQSQGFVDAQQEEHLPNAKHSFRRVHRDHADAPLPPLAICTGLANEFTRSVSSRHGPRSKLCDFANGKNCSSRVNPAVRVAANGRVGRLSSKQHGEDTNHVAPDRERHPNRDSWRMSFLMDPADSPRRLSCKNGSQRLWVDQTLCTNTYFMLGALQKSFNNRSLQMVFTVLLVLYICMLFQGLSA